MIKVREFVLADFADALALWEGEEGIEICEGDSPEEIAGYLKRNPGLSRVAEADGKIVGVALCGHDGRRGWIYHLAVAREYRRQKVGKLLIDACLDGLRGVGLKRAIILVAGDNPGAHQFWLRNGWEDIEGALAMTREL
ncbi:MAG TPA: GNAT family N-acetyltransferase [Chthoniobacterales bacterium]|jgi:ribosomal protein S18 acetylase RimI-like enzyme